MEQARLEVTEIENSREQCRYHESRTKWIMKEDKGNVDFFRMMGKIKQQMGVKNLRREDGTLSHGLVEMWAMATNFYKKLLTSEGI